MDEIIKRTLGFQPENDLPIIERFCEYRDYVARRIWLLDELDQEVLGVVGRKIIFYNEEDKDIPAEKRKPITLLFDSIGGIIDYYKVLASLVSVSQTPVIGINMVEASSAAALLFLFCRKRYTLSNAKFLFHYGEIELHSEAKNAIEEVKKYEREVNKFVNIIASHTKYCEEYIREQMQHDWRIDADEALKYGIVDGIIDKPEQFKIFLGEDLNG